MNVGDMLVVERITRDIKIMNLNAGTIVTKQQRQWVQYSLGQGILYT